MIIALLTVRAKRFLKFLTPSDIKYVSGSVEAACGLGLADAVVDLVETGTTMIVRYYAIIANNVAIESLLHSNQSKSY